MHKLRSVTSTLVVLAVCCGQVAADQSSLLGPPETNGPVVVRASFQLNDIDELNEQAETFQFSGVLVLRWRDERQAFDPAAAGVDEKVFQGNFQFNEISPAWFPQVVLVNESGMFESQGVVLRALPDGSQTLIQTLNAVAKAEFNMRRFPFDSQRLEAVFEVLGFDKSEVVFQAEPDTGGSGRSEIRIPQWTIAETGVSTRDRPEAHAGNLGIASALVVSVHAKRQSFFINRLVVIPLIIIVLLSFSVFWMDRSSLGDRISVSFIGILTGVAYQIVISEILPRISYFTLMNGFLNLSFLTMCGTVVINLIVGALDRNGRPDAGDRLDHRCRWAFPLTYAGLMLIMVAVTFSFY